MSIADHFEHAPNTGFVRGYDSGSARRQFHVSLVLLTVIVIAASALAFLIRFDSPSRTGEAPAVGQTVSNQGGPTQSVPAYAGRL